MINIKSDTISFAWYQLLRNLDKATKTPIQRGSYAGDYRLQFDSISIEIDKPYYDMIPIMPAGCENLQPTTQEYIENYFESYIMNKKVSENETYTYGSRIALSIEKVIDKLKNPYNNHMVIEIAQPEDIELKHAPCMRLIDIKVVDGCINLHVYFRSWELWAGLPTNLAAMEMLRQYLCHCSGFDEKRGKLFTYSSGLHIYGHNIKNIETVLRRKLF